jgi:hypothetical protein
MVTVPAKFDGSGMVEFTECSTAEACACSSAVPLLWCERWPLNANAYLISCGKRRNGIFN